MMGLMTLGGLAYVLVPIVIKIAASSWNHFLVPPKIYKIYNGIYDDDFF